MVTEQVYADTSVLIAYYYREKESDEAQAMLNELSYIVFSELNTIEFISASRKKVRLGHSKDAEIQKVFSLFERHKKIGLYKQISLEKDHFESAEFIIKKTDYPLRTLDAIHLGIANTENLKLLSFDEIMIEVAEEFNLPILKKY